MHTSHPYSLPRRKKKRRGRIIECNREKRDMLSPIFLSLFPPSFLSSFLHSSSNSSSSSNTFFFFFFLTTLSSFPPLIFHISSSACSPLPTHPFCSCAGMQNQQFRCGQIVISVQVHCDHNGNHYSDKNDIIRNFPNATGFKVGGEDVVFLKDENNNQ